MFGRSRKPKLSRKQLEKAIKALEGGQPQARRRRGKPFGTAMRDLDRSGKR